MRYRLRSVTSGFSREWLDAEGSPCRSSLTSLSKRSVTRSGDISNRGSVAPHLGQVALPTWTPKKHLGQIVAFGRADLYTFNTSLVSGRSLKSKAKAPQEPPFGESLFQMTCRRQKPGRSGDSAHRFCQCPKNVPVYRCPEPGPTPLLFLAVMTGALHLASGSQDGLCPGSPDTTIKLGALRVVSPVPVLICRSLLYSRPPPLSRLLASLF